MGALYIDGVLQPDPMPCRLPVELIGCFSQKPDRVRVRLQPLNVDIGRTMDNAAYAAIDLMIDARARRLRGRRELLDQKIAPGMSALGPEALIERATILLEIDRKEPRRLGFGGEDFEIWLQAARRLGAWLLAERADAA